MAYKNRYGLIEFETQERIIKSGYWFKELSQNNGLVSEVLCYLW